MFVVSSKDMVRVVKGFQTLHGRSPVYWNGKLKPFTQVDVETDTVDWTWLGRALFKMNIESAVERYGENHGMDAGNEMAFEYVRVIASRVQCLKAMQSLRYQCSEGSIDETPLYKLLDDAIGSLAESICRELPEYDRAEW